MFLAKIAIYIFVFTFVLFLAYRALWLIFFLFNFRFWEMIMTKIAPGFLHTLSPLQSFMLFAILAFITYLSIFFTTMKMPLIRYIFLAVMFIAAIRVYNISDILFFKDYFQKSGMWSLDFWIKQIRAVFTLNSGQMLNMGQGVIQNFVDFFVKIVKAVKS
jgi:hypothetical protein